MAAFEPSVAHATHVGETLDADQSYVTSNDQLLGALAQWERLPAAVRDARLAQLVQFAQHRQQHLVKLLQKSPKLAAARLMPGALQRRMPAQAAAYLERDVEMSGSVVAHVADDFAKGVGRTQFRFHSADGSAPLDLHMADASGSEADMLRWSGRRMSLRAVRIGQNLAVVDKRLAQFLAAGGTTTTTTASTSGTTAAAATTVQGDQKTLSILLNFSDSALSCTPQDVANRLFGGTGSTVNNNYRESSGGQVSFSGQAVGPYTIGYSSTGACDYLGWAAAAEAAAKAAGVDTSQFARINYVTPANGACGWTGLAYMPGRQSWVQACMVTGAYSHELGHNLSLHHAATPTMEYGDGSDPMGGAQLVGHNAPNRAMAGWMPAGTVLDVSAGGSYAIGTLSSAGATGTAQVLRVAKADTAEHYYVSLRQAAGLDATLATKYLGTLSVHRSAGTLPAKTYLLQNLAGGQSFNDPANGITITNQGVSGGTAVVAVTIGAGTCVRNAPVVASTPGSQAAAPGTALSYSVSVTNQNSAACPSAMFTLSQALPAGFTGTLGTPSVSLASGATASGTWVVSSAAAANDATYTLTATATESASGLSTAAHASYIVYAALACTRTDPLVSLSPSSLSGKAGATLAYGLTVTNRNSSACGNSTYNLAQSVPAGFGGSFGNATLALAPGATASTTWSVTAPATATAGTYAVTARAVDAATAAAQSATGSAVISAVDATPPVVAITSPSSGSKAGAKVVISASASDNVAVQAVEFYIDGALLARLTAAPYTTNWNARKAAAGTHVIRARAVDTMGNAAETSVNVVK